MATIPTGDEFLPDLDNRWPHPRQICATHGGRLSLLRAADGARDVGDGREGRDSGSGGSHSCGFAAATLDVADAGEDHLIRSVFKFFLSFYFLFFIFLG